MTKDLDGLSILVILFLKQMPPMFLKTKPQCSSKVKKNCYLLIVRPILEYASVVRSPHTQCDQDTRSCVSGQGSHVAHKCLIYRNR